MLAKFLFPKVASMIGGPNPTTLRGVGRFVKTGKGGDLGMWFVLYPPGVDGL